MNILLQKLEITCFFYIAANFVFWKVTIIFKWLGASRKNVDLSIGIWQPQKIDFFNFFIKPFMIIDQKWKPLYKHRGQLLNQMNI